MAYYGKGISGQVLTDQTAPTISDWKTSSGGGVSGPGSSTNNAVATWNGTGGTALFSPPTPLINSAGIQTNSNQPAWRVSLSANVGGVTGDGTVYPIIFDTKSFDQGSNYDTGTGLYTFPVAGIYQITVLYFVYVSSGASTSTQMIGSTLVNGSTSIRIADNSPNSLGLTTNEEFILVQSFLYQASASDTMAVNIQLANGTKNIGVAGGTNSCTFSGFLIC